MMPHSLHHAVRALVALACLLAGGSIARAQDSDQIESAGGTLYVVAFPDTTTNTFDARYPNQRYADKAILLIYSAVDARVSIMGRGYTNNVTTIGGSFTVVELMGGAAPVAPMPIVTEHCRPVDNTFRVESDVPIILYQYLVTRFGAEAWTPLPVDAWGRDYYAAAMPGEIGSNILPGGNWDYNRRNKMFPAEILVVAAYDDTRITIVPQGRVHDSCGTDTVPLMAGEAFQIQSYVDTLTANVGSPQPDFGGSRIFSTKPVGVITGNTRAQLVDEGVGLGRNAFKNMLIEWLSPIEQWGTEFVYMPTWDTTRATGAPTEDASAKRKAEFVRVYGPGVDPTGYYMDRGLPTAYDEPIDTGNFVQVRHKPNLACVHRTEAPAQAFMSSAAVVRYAGTTSGGEYAGAAYDAWGGYMVELTPRERWIGFAPFYASTHPGGLEHHVNVVTDTVHRNDVYLKSGSRFAFTRPIEGTDLIWGSMRLQPGVDYSLEGRNGARFAGFVYGTLTRGGHEEFRPNGIRPRGEDQQHRAARAGDESAQPLAPAAYEEYLAIAYGYPLAASRYLIGPGDSLDITTAVDCRGMCVTIRSLNADPMGLRGYRLENNVNARIVSVDPYPLTGATTATICITPIDNVRDASATLLITDRTGRTTRVPFASFAERADVTPVALSFGVMAAGTADTMEVTIVNPLARALTVVGVALAGANPAFAVLSPTSFPMTLAPQESLTVRVRASPPSSMSYRDTLVVRFECSRISVPLTVETTPSLATPSEGALVTGLELAQPNPTTGPIEIRFSLARRAHATLVVYDERGERVASLVDEVRASGVHAVRFDLSLLPAGVYHYRLTSDGESRVRSLVKK